MREKDMSDLTGAPNIISGIHNYCDRWCERCAFTARCAVYAAEEADLDVDPAARDISNAAFWQKLAAIFAETEAMISAMAKERGIDLSAEALEPIRQQKEIQRSDARNHPLAKAAEEYAFAVSKWFEEEASIMETVSDVLEDWDDERNRDDDYIEVIRWYQFFIATKLTRALMSHVDEDDYLDEDSARDSDGSAKAALIGIDRSIGAWKLMHSSRDEPSDRIQDLMLVLEKLRLGVEREFSHARDFIRPGFDETNPDMLH